MKDDKAGAISGSNSAQQLRRARARRFLIRILIWVVAPTFLAVIYFGFWASPQYQSTAVVAVQSNVGGKNTSAKRDAMLVREYSLSRSMLENLTLNHKFKESYEDSDNDFWARLDSDANTEELYQYYLDKVQVEYESQPGTLTLKVRAFSPEASRGFATAIIKSAEEMANVMYERASSDRTNFAEEKLKRAELRLGKARQALLEQPKPAESPSDTRPNPSAPEPVTNASATNASLEPLVYEKELAQKSYEVALGALEKARIEVLRERRYIVTISAPSLPSGSIYPRRLWGITTVFVLSVVLMGVLTMLAAAVREHARF